MAFDDSVIKAVSEKGQASTDPPEEGNKTPEQIAAEEEAARVAAGGATQVKTDEVPTETDDEKKLAEILAKEPDQLTEEELKVVTNHNESRYTAIQEKEEAERTKEEKEFAEKYLQEKKESSVIFQLADRFGRKAEEYTEDNDGLVKLTDDVRSTALVEGLDNYFKDNPVVRAFDEHIKKGYSVESFIAQQQVQKLEGVQIKDDDPKQQEQVYRSYLADAGNDQDEIDQLVETAKAKGTLLDKSKGALAKMVQAEKDGLTAEMEQEKAQAALAQQERQQREAEISTLIKKGKVLDATIPQPEIKDFTDFILKPIGKTAEGVPYTQADLAWSKLTVEQQLFLDYIVKNGFKMVGGGVSRRIGDINGLSLKSKKVANPNLNSGGGGTTGATMKEMSIEGVKELFYAKNR